MNAQTGAASAEVPPPIAMLQLISVDFALYLCRRQNGTELGEEHYPAWGELLYSVRTGEIAFDHAFGMPVWEFFAKNPDNAKIFNDAMSGMTAQANEAILSQYDFAGIKTLVDVGGGHGGLITSILQRHAPG